MHLAQFASACTPTSSGCLHSMCLQDTERSVLSTHYVSVYPPSSFGVCWESFIAARNIREGHINVCDWHLSQDHISIVDLSLSLVHGKICYPVPGNVALRSRERGRSPGAGAGDAPAAPPSSIGCATVRPQRQALCVLRLAGLRRRACVGRGLSGRGRLLWGNRLLQGPMIMRLNSLGTCTTRSGPSAQYGKMSHRALSFITPLPLLAGPCWSALSHRQVQVQ